jgi:hypothetical protein
MHCHCSPSKVSGTVPCSFFQAGAAHPAGEGHQRGIAGAAGDVTPGRPFPGCAKDIDNDTAAARLHRRIDRAAHIDVAEHFQVPSLTPPRLVDRLQVASRNGAGIVHQDIDVRTGCNERPRGIAVAEIHGVDRHGNVVPGLDSLPGAFKIRFGARRQMQVAAFLGKLPGACQTNSLGSTGDEGELAAQVQIHADLLMLPVAATRPTLHSNKHKKYRRCKSTEKNTAARCWRTPR